MAQIRPFRGLRYRANSQSPLDTFVAPPYDVISPEQREELASQGDHQIVQLTLPEQRADDRSKYVKYARSASTLAEWRREGAMELEERPSFYRYIQTFSLPNFAQPFVRLSLMVTLKVEPYENGVVLPHEQTFPKHKEDRLRLLEATRTHLECIYGLFEDPGEAINEVIRQAPGTNIADVTTEDVRHQLDRIDDAAAIDQIVRGIEEKKIWIADGHHRYETALNFRASLPVADKLIAEDFMMIALSSMADPGLVLLPTHRMLKTLPMTSDEMKAKLAEHFDLRECPNNSLVAELEKCAGQRGVFAIALPGGTGFLATCKDLASATAQFNPEFSQNLKELDVTILHELIFSQILGLSGLEFFSYTRVDQEALEAVENGSPASFLMNPPSVEDMRIIALGGEKMPQKSTYYYPKILSGLVVWSLADFE